MTMLEGAILAQLMGFLSNGTGTNKDFDSALVQFEKVIHDTAIKHFQIPQESVEQFVQEQSQEIQKLFGQMQEVAVNYRLWGQTPDYFCKRDIAKQACGFPGQLIASFLLSGKHLPEFSPEDEQLVKNLVSVMENEDSVHDFLDTKPYVDHWGGMTEQDFVDLARRIVIDLNAMHAHADEDNKFLALTRQERIDDLMDLLKKCKGTLYAMWKMSLYEECLKDPRGMQIRFVDNQKNNWQKKTEGRKRKLRDTEIEEQEAAAGIRVKKRRLSSKTKPEVPLEELGMEYFDDPRGVPLAPPEKPLARKGVNPSRSSGAPKRILRGPKCRAIEAIRQANAEREAADSATGGDSLKALAAVGLDIPLPLTIVPAQGATVREVALAMGWRTLPPAQEPTGVTGEYQVEEVLPEQAVEVYRQTGPPEAVTLPHDGGSHEYSADGMDNMQATSANTSGSDPWDFLLDPQLQEQRVTRRHSRDNFPRMTNYPGPTYSNIQFPRVNFSGHGSNTAFRAGGSHYFDNASPRVPANISEVDNSSGVARYGSPQFMAGSGAQMSQNTYAPRHTSGIGILNPTSQGHQGFNFNAQRSGATNHQIFQAGPLPAQYTGNVAQYVNPSWLQNSGQSSSAVVTTASSTSVGAASNVLQNRTSYAGKDADEEAEADAIASMTGNEWLDDFDDDLNGGMGFQF